MVPQGYGDRVVLKPREELDQVAFSESIILPGNATTTDRGYCLGEQDATAICEVVSVGRKVKTLAVGDVVLFDLHGVSQIVYFDGEGYLMMSEENVRARLHDAGNREEEYIEPLFNYVLTIEDRKAFQERVVGSVLAPDSAFEGAGVPDSISRFVLDRVVEAGPVGAHPDEPLGDGDLVFFNPLASCRFRRFGHFYRLVAREDLLGALGE